MAKKYRVKKFFETLEIAEHEGGLAEIWVRGMDGSGRCYGHLVLSIDRLDYYFEDKLNDLHELVKELGEVVDRIRAAQLAKGESPVPTPETKKEEEL